MFQANTVLNRVFSPRLFKSLIAQQPNASAVYAAAIKRYINIPVKRKNIELIEEFYKQLKKNYRNEYFYRNVLLKQLLFKFHKPSTTVALSEVPVAKSIADFILINGEAIVYEIKTDLDNFERLDSQLSDYYRAFDKVCVVVSEKNAPIMLKRLKNHKIGIYYITKRGALRSLREPKTYRKELNVAVIFKILRKKEYENILSHYYELPKVSAFEYYRACQKLFKTIPLNKIYMHFKEQLKNRRHIDSSFISLVPKELVSLVYFAQFKTQEYFALKNFLEKEYRG